MVQRGWFGRCVCVEDFASLMEVPVDGNVVVVFFRFVLLHSLRSVYIDCFRGRTAKQKQTQKAKKEDNLNPPYLRIYVPSV